MRTGFLASVFAASCAWTVENEANDAATTANAAQHAKNVRRIMAGACEGGDEGPGEATKRKLAPPRMQSAGEVHAEEGENSDSPQRHRDTEKTGKSEEIEGGSRTSSLKSSLRPLTSDL
jgi:hypothetical protein